MLHITPTIKGCYNGNYDCALLIIRWKHKLWGNRTALELADTAQLEKFMAHDAVQDLLDKVRDQLTVRQKGFLARFSLTKCVIPK